MNALNKSKNFFAVLTLAEEFLDGDNRYTIVDSSSSSYVLKNFRKFREFSGTRR